MACQRYQLILQYEGTNFAGWQIQPHARSIQETVELVLSRLFNQPIHVVGSGRTDAGVHAFGQVAHFDVNTVHDPGSMISGMNALLPPSIRIFECNAVDRAFHARFSAIRRGYRYVIYNRPVCPPNLSRFVTHVRKPIQVSELIHVFQPLLGTHDFASFCAAGGAEETTIRSLDDISVRDGAGLIQITIVGNAFLRKMIRMIVGVAVGLVHKGCDSLAMHAILKQKSTQYPYAVFPPTGLYLDRVWYPAPYRSSDNMPNFFSLIDLRSPKE
jgi:tRNA pseudouridine38-40 synthase